MSREKPLIVVLLSFFFSRAHTRKSQWVVTVTKYRSQARGYSDSVYTYYNATYSVLMLTKQDSLHNHIATEGVSNYFSIKPKNESML